MKQTIKKIAATAATLGLAAPLAAFAQGLPAGAGGLNSTNNPTNVTTGLSDQGITAVLTTIMMWILGLVGVLSVIAFAIAGVMYLTSAGNEDQASTAKRTMVYAIIGIVVALIGLIIFLTVKSVLSNSGTAF